MVAADGQLLAPWVKRHGRDRHGNAVGFGWVGLSALGNQADDQRLGIGSIEFGSLLDPLFDQRNLIRGQWIGILGHSLVLVVVRDKTIQLAVVRLAGRDWVGTGIAGLFEQFEGVKLITSLGLFLAVASL